MVEGVPTNNQRGRRTLSPLRRFGQDPLYSPHRLVSQSAVFSEGPYKHKTYSPLDDQLVILSSSKALNYFRTRRDEIRCVFYPL